VGPFELQADGGAPFTYHSHGEGLGKTLFWRGIDAFEPGTSRLFCDIAKQTGTMLDVGAYNGYYTLLARSVNPSVRSICFEPMPMIRAWLCEHLELNRALDHVTVVAAAVSDRGDERVRFFTGPAVYAPGGSLVAEFKNKDRPAD
jgi:hypothetical protein